MQSGQPKKVLTHARYKPMSHLHYCGCLGSCLGSNTEGVVRRSGEKKNRVKKNGERLAHRSNVFNGQSLVFIYEISIVTKIARPQQILSPCDHPLS